MRKWLKVFVPMVALCLSEGVSAAGEKEAETPAATVLFICEHGNVKSLMAASYFNQLAKERHLPFTALSRGIEPNSTTVPPVIAEGLRSQGFDVSAFHPAKVQAADMDSARRVVAISVPAEMLAGLGKNAPQAWNDVPPATLEFNASAAAIKAHIENLLQQLAAQ